MVLLFGLSITLSGIISYLIFSGLKSYYHNFVDYDSPLVDIRMFIRNIGDINLFLLLFVPLAIMFFYLLTKTYSTYFKKISKGIHFLAQGNFEHKIDIQSKDEFSTIAQDINLASAKLEAAIQRGDFSESSKEQLIVNLAHDLRTPLTSILGYLDLLLVDEGLTADESRHFLTIAHTKSQRLEKLINELFEITKMNYGMLPVEKRDIDITSLLHQLKEELYPVLEKNHLRARINSSPNLIIHADGDLIARVFENLLMNAIRYGYEGKYVDVNSFTEENDVVIQVINYGDSIPADDIPHLFDVFYTGDKSRNPHESSTGLGLFIAKNVVEQHSGAISVDSNLIRTIFEVRLPQENIQQGK